MGKSRSEIIRTSIGRVRGALYLEMGWRVSRDFEIKHQKNFWLNEENKIVLTLSLYLSLLFLLLFEKRHFLKSLFNRRPSSLSLVPYRPERISWDICIYISETIVKNTSNCPTFVNYDGSSVTQDLLNLSYPVKNMDLS